MVYMHGRLVTKNPRPRHNDVQTSEFRDRGFEGGFEVFPGGYVGADEECLSGKLGYGVFGFGFEG